MAFQHIRVEQARELGCSHGEPWLALCYKIQSSMGRFGRVQFHGAACGYSIGWLRPVGRSGHAASAECVQCSGSGFLDRGRELKFETKKKSLAARPVAMSSSSEARPHTACDRPASHHSTICKRVSAHLGLSQARGCAMTRSLDFAPRRQSKSMSSCSGLCCKGPTRHGDQI